MPTDVLDATATSGALAAAPAGGGLRIGDQLGRYVIERVLGAGGMGLVYAAHDPDLDRRVAIKVLRGDASDESRVRLLREARAMAKVSHPNVITVYEVGTDGGVDFVAMELLEGGTLAEWLRAERRPAVEVLRRLRAAGAGLAAAHASGLVHRDFKPANVLLGRDGRVVVTDFGLARGFESDAVAETLPATAEAARASTATGARASGPTAPTVGALDITQAATDRPATATAPSITRPNLSARSGDLASTLTRTGAMIGTPAYMAPEQFSGGTVGPAADQFAFAVALWEGLTGARPFAGASIDELRRAVDRGPPDASALPRAVRPAVVRALARDPGGRWPDVAAMLAALDRGLARPRQLKLGVAAALGLAAVAGGVMLTRGDERRATAPAAACALTGAELDATWTPTVMADLDRRFADAPAWRELRTGLERFVADWRTERAAACAAPDAPSHHGRIACLAGLNAELEAALTLLPQVRVEDLPRAGLADVLPPPESCKSGRRAAMPALPTDPSTRAALSKLIAAASTAKLLARGPTPDQAKAKADEVVAEARRLASSYPPALAIALETKAMIIHVAGECAQAMPLYEETATAAEAASADGLRAMARIGLLECAIASSSDLAQIQRYADQARAAIQRAGDDRQLTAALEMTLAGLDATVGKIDEAIVRVAAARTIFVEYGDLRRAGNATLFEAELRMLVDGWGQRAAIEQLYRDGLALRERVYGDGHPMTESVRLGLGLILEDRDPVEANRLVSQAAASVAMKPAPADAIALRGRVVDERGRPLTGAQVLAASQIWARPDGVPAVFDDRFRSQTTTGADGRFALTAPPGALVTAWTDTGLARAVPVSAARELRIDRPAALELEIVETRATGARDPLVALASRAAIAIVAVLDAPGSRVSTVLARRADRQRWNVTRTYPGRLQLMAITLSPLGDTLLASWPLTVAPGATATASLSLDLRGAVVDVVVRAERGTIPTAQIMLLAGRTARAPRTVGDLSAHWRNPRRHIANAAPITDANQTEIGRPLYRPGDIHGRMAAVLPGIYTACVIPFAGDVRDRAYLKTLTDEEDLEVKCTPITVGDAPVQAFVVEAPPMKNLPTP
ncbi:MAG: protein kinase [Kofleriaceae bacterium]|nr:protein kinase [Kofleriaceae bacterium]MBP9171831.1 protein kinase [Kofleriaceae bacterium]MBP9862611.1 protein kinase [Kofleriaceae bacterium]